MLIPILMLITTPETTWWRCRAIVGLTRPLPTASPDQDEDGQWSLIMAIIIFNVKQWWSAAAVGSNQLAQIWWMMIGKATENRWQNKDIMMMTRKICSEIANKYERTKSGNVTNQSHRPEKSEHRNWSTSSSNLKTQGLILMICCEKQTCAMMMSRKEPITMMKSKLFQGSLTYSRSPKAANLTTNSKAKKAVKTRFMKSRNSVYGSGWMVAINICVAFYQADLRCCWYIPDYKIPLRVERCWCKLQQR